MFENIANFFRKLTKSEKKEPASKDAAKERLHLVLMQDRANVSADFLELMKQEIIDVIKKYIEIDEKEIDVRLTNQENEDGTNGAPALYANIPILNIKNEMKKEVMAEKKEETEETKQTAETESTEQNEEQNTQIVDSENKEQIEIKEEVIQVEREAQEQSEEQVEQVAEEMVEVKTEQGECVGENNE